MPTTRTRLHHNFIVVTINDNTGKVKAHGTSTRNHHQAGSRAHRSASPGLSEIDYLCSGTLSSVRRCAADQAVDAPRTPTPTRSVLRMGHMKGGKLVHRMVTPEQPPSWSWPSQPSQGKEAHAGVGR